MFLSDATMKLLVESGLPADKLVALLQSLRADEEAAGLTMRRRSADRERQAKHREAQASRSVTDETVTKRDNADVTPNPAPPLSPRTPLSPPLTRESISTREREDAGFARFWAAYPRKTAKADARKAYAKAWRKLPPMDEEAIIAGGLERAKAGWTDPQFIPHPATWLNGERWQDEPADVIHLAPRKAHERSHPDAKLAAKQANYERAWTGSERAARFRGEP